MQIRAIGHISNNKKKNNNNNNNNSNNNITLNIAKLVSPNNA
jgi:hypothetical protein